jgi:dTDP-4-dehydrorhamnose reductase
MPRLLLTGASGQLGAYLLRHLAGLDLEVIAWSGGQVGKLFGVPLQPIDLTERGALVTAFAAASPDVVLHAAALARVADCHRAPERAAQVNTAVTATLTELCARAGARLVLVSTDLVFDGERAPYHETDPPAPLSVYGRTKAAAELAVLVHPRNAVARVGLLFGPSLNGRPSFFDEQVNALRTGRPVTLFADEWRTPLDLDSAARALAELALADVNGVLHVAGAERLSRLEMGRELARFLGAGPGAIVAAQRADVPASEPRPCDTSLACTRWREAFPGLPWLGFGEALRRVVGNG